MSLNNAQIIDAIGTEKATENVVLTIADEWDWSDERNHLIALQSKINAYLEFVASGQVFDEYPTAKDRQLVIDVVSRFPVPLEGRAFLLKAAEVACELRILLTSRLVENPQKTCDEC
jgi:hypothetical protein